MFYNAFQPTLLPRRWGREARDPVAADRPYPDLLSDLKGDCAERERLVERVVDDLLELQRVRVDLHDVRRAPEASLPGMIFQPFPVCQSQSSPLFSPANRWSRFAVSPGAR